MDDCDTPGEVAEWLKAQHWKCCLGVTLTRVRIPPSPLNLDKLKLLGILDHHLITVARLSTLGSPENVKFS